MSIEVKTIGFDGPSRSGKGTQIELLRHKLTSLSIPFFVVRGDGTKQHNHNDPWWNKMNNRLHSPEVTNQDWHVAAYRLAQELVHIRDTVLPQMAATLGAPCAFLLVDRTLLSRTMIPREENPEDVISRLYPESARQEGLEITPQMVSPDIIFHISATKEVLLARLDKDDPKYEFRKEMIMKRTEWYKDAAKFLPPEIQSRIVIIDGEQAIDEIFDIIWVVLLEKYPMQLKHIPAMAIPQEITPSV